MQALLARLESNRKAFLDELTGLTPMHWSARSSEERWSILDVVEHVASVEIGVLEVLKTRLFVRPCEPEHKAKTAGKDEIIVATMKDRITRRPAPDLVKPTGRWPAPDAAVDAFDRARKGAIALLTGETRNLRDFCAPHPSFKSLDGYQWMLFVVTHTDRHGEQIREIKSERGFPR